MGLSKTGIPASIMVDCPNSIDLQGLNLLKTKEKLVYGINIMVI